MKKVLVGGAGGFIGSHLVTKLKKEGHYVVGIDLKYPEFEHTEADKFFIQDMRDFAPVKEIIGEGFDEIYQLAADMGGAGYIFTGEHDADVMSNSSMINLNVLRSLVEHNMTPKIFYSSSACIYPEGRQESTDVPSIEEWEAYPANPDSEYGWEKLFSERLYASYARNYGIPIRIARFHNIFGEQSCYNNGKEKAPAAMCRKVAEAKEGGEIVIWGDGLQTRSFLYITECLEGVERLMQSDYTQPVNIGSDFNISINDLARMVMKIAGKNINIRNDISNTAIGVRGRNSNNELIGKVLGWRPSLPLEHGMEKLYHWVNAQVNQLEPAGK